MTTRTQHTATPPPHVDYADELRRITKGKRGAFSRVENEAFGVWLTAQRGTEAHPRVTEEDAAGWLKEVQQHTRRTWPVKVFAALVTLMVVAVLVAYTPRAGIAMLDLWQFYQQGGPLPAEPATLPTAAVVQPIDKGSQQRPNVAPAPVDAAPAAAPLAPVVKDAQEVAKPAPVVAAPIVSESDKGLQAAPGTAERVQAGEATPEAQKGAQGRSGGEREETVKGSKDK